jgi:hypothetical protein
VKKSEAKKSADDDQLKVMLTGEYTGGLSQGMKTLLNIIAMDFIWEFREKQAEVLRNSEDPQLEFP